MSLIPDLFGNATFINNLLFSVGVLVSAVPQLLQNGPSPWGVLPSPVLPKFLGGPNDAPPWGNRTANGTDPYTETPDTGVTRNYEFTIRRGQIAPDGFLRNVLLINDQFPGPLIEANWGDHVRVVVHSEIDDPAEGVVLHWHGLLQKETPWYDGVASVMQCPVAPNKTFVYDFVADLYGTSWYHSHYSAQYAGGLYGPMVIYGPTNADYDVDIGPIMLGDYYHKEYYELVQQGSSNNPAYALLVTADNTIINGKMAYDCNLAPNGSNCTSNAGLAKFNFTSGLVHRLRLINPSAAVSPMLFSIDGHSMTVIANDFVPVVPYETNLIQLAVGQRTDILVRATGRRGSTYWMRARQPPLCSLVVQPFALGAIYYEGTRGDEKPRSLPQPEFLDPVLIRCANDPLQATVPFYEMTPDPEPQATVEVQITQTVNETGHVLYEMNGQTFRANYNHPLLLLAREGNVSYPENPQWNVYNFGSNESVRIVFQNNLPFSHPMHIHGQNMFILDEGIGSWDGRTIVNPRNPQRRDTQLLQPNGYLVVQLFADNPGVWPFHCHIAWHVGQGLYINVMQRPDRIRDFDIPQSIYDGCDEWDYFSRTGFVNQIDSGMRLME